MLIFPETADLGLSRHFVVVVATGSFIKFQADAEKEAAAIEKKINKVSWPLIKAFQKNLAKHTNLLILNCFLSSTDAVFFLIAKNLIATLRQMRCSNSSILNSRKL